MYKDLPIFFKPAPVNRTLLFMALLLFSAKTLAQDTQAPVMVLPANMTLAPSQYCAYSVPGTGLDPLSVTDNSAAAIALTWSLQRLAPNPGLVSENFSTGSWNPANFEIGSPTGLVSNGGYRSGAGDDRGTLRTVADFQPTAQQPLYVTATLRFVGGEAIAFMGIRSTGLKNPGSSNEPSSSLYFRIHNFADGFTELANGGFDAHPGNAFYSNPVRISLIDNGTQVSGSLTNTVTGVVIPFSTSSSYNSGAYRVVFSGGASAVWDDILISKGPHETMQQYTSGTGTLTGTVIPTGNSEVVWTATDPSNNSSSASFALTVEGCPSGTVWNAGTWTLGPPDPAIPAVISTNYSGASFAASTLTVNNSNTLTITSGTTVTVGNMVNNGGIVVEDGGNFIQTASGTYSGSGSFTANRNSASAANKYAFWSSPVSAANIYAVFPGFTPQYAMTYNTATDYYTVVPNPTATTAGTGYSVKIPAAAPNLTFSGIPNNGSINKTLTLAGGNYNLVGNPYPSSLDLAAFYAANTANIESTLWFWDNTSNSVTTQAGSTTVNVGYATYNAAGSTWVAAPTAPSPSGNAAKTGQGFIVEAISNTLSFTNSMRVAAAGASLNKTFLAGEGKYWLKLTTPYNSHFTQAVTYQQGANNAFDAYDSKAIATGSDAFYSLVGPEKLIIQGKEIFHINDVVALGNKHFENGQFTIALMQTEGLFANGQAVYLKDKLLGTETNLQNGAYTFASNAGDFTNRFEIVYKQSFLGTASSAGLNELKVYPSGNDFVINSPVKIRSVMVYDATGRLVQVLKPNEVQAAVSHLSKGVYLLEIRTDSGTATKKMIK